MKLLQFLLILQYLPLAHAALLWQQPVMQLAAVLMLLTGLMLPALSRYRASAWVGLTSGVLALALLFHLQLLHHLLLTTPVVVPLLLLIVFAQTLLPGREPLVTAIGEASRGPLDADMRRYTRQVTLLWSVIFALMLSSGSLLLVAGANLALSWLGNIINPLVSVIVFAGEYLYRKRRFPDHAHPGFLDYVSIVRQARRR